MMKIKSIINFIITFLLLCSHYLSSATNNPMNFNSSVDQLFSKWDTDSSPGAVVAIIEKGKVIFKECYGLANLEYDIPITSKTIFDLASVSKQFTAMAILLLEQKGKLNLEDHIHLYLPELPDYQKAVTIQHLLHHTSGLWDYWRVIKFSDFRTPNYLKIRDVIRLMQQQKKLMFEPGTKWEYSNTNYTLLAEIVQRVTGEPISTWASNNMFNPLGMKNTFFQSDCHLTVKNRADSYWMLKGNYLHDPVNVDFAGQSHVFSTIDDMVKWINNFRENTLGGSETIKKMYEKGRLNSGEEIFYAAGLGVRNYNGIRAVNHSGATASYRTMMIYCPEIELGIVILSNTNSIKPEKLGYQILDLYLGKLPIKNDIQDDYFIQLDASGYQSWVGSYKIEDKDIVAVIVWDGSHLIGALQGIGKDYFYPISENQVDTKLMSCQITFMEIDNGQSQRIKINFRGDELWGHRIDGNLIQFESYCGKYYSNELATVYEIRLDNDEIKLCHRWKDDLKLFPLSKDILFGDIGFLHIHFVEKKVKGFSLENEVFGQSFINFKKFK